MVHQTVEATIVDTADAVRIVREAQEAGRTVVSTCGCFDIFHAGHAAFLAAAARQGDMLVVCLNSDRSVRQLKGPQRPIFPFAARATVLASQTSIDLVVGFDELTPVALLTALAPNVHCKGDEYQHRPIPERTVVEGQGGTVALLPQAGLSSSSSALRRLGLAPCIGPICEVPSELDGLSADDLKAKAVGMGWWHELRLPDGTVLSGRISYELRRDAGERIFRFGSGAGLSAVDVGANCGGYSFLLEECGYGPVVAVDLYEEAHYWQSMSYLCRAEREAKPSMIREIHVAVTLAQSAVAIHSGDVERWETLAGLGQFDLVFCADVLYHLRSPVIAVANLVRLCKPGGRVIIWSALVDAPGPLIYYWPGYAGDGTNHSYPTPEAIKRMLEVEGVGNVDIALTPKSDYIWEGRTTFRGCVQGTKEECA